MIKKILVMAGGTGGHVIPALTIAKALRAKGVMVEWLGSREGLEAELVSNIHIPLHFIARIPIRNRDLKTLLLAPIRLINALFQAIKIINTVKPDVVLGMGGYISFPGGVATWLLRKPLAIHEQNAVAGLANRWLAKLARVRFQAFPNVFSKAITVGNPIRENILQLPNPAQRFSHRSGQLKLLVLGGSLGALALNRILPTAVAAINQPLEIWHIAGKGKVEEVKIAYENLQIQAQIDAFVEDMASAYAWADIVLCRAGALTISELTAVGIGSILIPYPHSMDNHQLSHACYLANSGAGFLIEEKELTAEALVKILQSLQQDRAKLLTMANAAYRLGMRESTLRIVECLLKQE